MLSQGVDGNNIKNSEKCIAVSVKETRSYEKNGYYAKKRALPRYSRVKGIVRIVVVDHRGQRKLIYSIFQVLLSLLLVI